MKLEHYRRLVRPFASLHLKAYRALPMVLAMMMLVACAPDPDVTSGPVSSPRATAASPTETVAAPLETTIPRATAEPQSAAVGPAITVDIVDLLYKDLTVRVGTAVKWVNRDPFPHTTTSGAPEAESDLWDSGAFPEGDSFSFTFD